ncbi:thiamine pyrophosphate-dependent enzyme [Paenarthrobacter sp. Z7-10]|uniref:thiamine pyrophosphate-dependent enzyme n=1 Tax=Paenarthrobacter sp. Z7-10 TaxID=2787635 RepID=UPI003FA6CCED
MTLSSATAGAALVGADAVPAPSGPELRRLYELMVAVRHLDTSAVAWQRQGLIPGYAPELGQEAAQVGSGFAVDLERDFVFPTYREMGVARAMGVDMVGYMSTHKATWHGGMYDPVASRMAPIQAVVAGSVLHAVGWAHGQTLNVVRENSVQGNQSDEIPDRQSAEPLGVAVAYFGDGASSQGDVHEAMNFAAVMKAPVVFFTQNNGWAISVPTEKQVAGGSVAARAAGYGIPALQIDGNDVAAVLMAMRQALAHCRAGNGPVLIEAMTYRRGPHSTSDDPGRYRTLEAERQDAGADPISRLREKLLAEGLADQEFFDSALAAAKVEEEEIRAGMASLDSRPGSEMFDFVFQESTPALAEQARRWREETEHV